MFYQQGDVIVDPWKDTIPDKKNPIRSGLQGLLIAKGEKTGHFHRVVGGAVMGFLCQNTIFFNVIDGANVIHEEHDQISLPAGLYCVRKVREYNHFEEEAREVLD